MSVFVYAAGKFKLKNIKKESRTAAYQSETPAEPEGTANMGTATQVDPKEVKGKVQTFYQVLIDTRDCPHIVSCYFLCFL